MEVAHPFIKNEFLADLLKPKRICFIVNPKAGTNMQSRISECVKMYLNHQKFEYGIWFTEHSGHATDLAKKAIAEEYEIVVAVGGDGSINEVATALIGTEVILGIIPAGSGNGLAMHLGYGRNMDKAMKKLNKATEKVIDCGLLNGRPFFNVAGLGFDGMVSNLMKGTGKRGFFNYMLKSVEAGLKYTPKSHVIEIDGQVIEHKCFTISIANGPMYGYNFKIAPSAKLDDNALEIVVLKDAPRWQYFAYTPLMLNDKIYQAPFTEHFTGQKVIIRSKGKNLVHLDGEGLELEGDLTFQVVPKALRILVPEVI
jgi:diacylglycerol kinase (ATP)